MEISQNLLYFGIRHDKFAVKMQSVVKVVSEIKYEESYLSVPIICGKWPYRGKEIFLIDLKRFLEQKQTFRNTSLSEIERPSDKESIVILNVRGQMMGLLVDRVCGVASPRKVYAYPYMASMLENRYFEGIAKINDDLVIILSEQNLIDDRELELLKV